MSKIKKPDASTPKTTRPEANLQREQETNTSVPAQSGKRKLDAFPDKIDVRDWFYQPSLSPLPNQIINCIDVPLILDQGTEGACTGFAMASVINYHLVKNGRCELSEIGHSCASPRMLYEMARRYDEWPGEEYEGSSARGTIKGWVAHGVVNRILWKDDMHGPDHLDNKLSNEALKMPTGAYFRVMHRQVRDMHSALSETGILYATLMVHSGWAAPGALKKEYEYLYKGKKEKINLPIIERKGRASSGHAIAIVGYTVDGFIVQNSWGSGWGEKGFALLPYEDWVMHASDCWVVQLGVPIETNLWAYGFADTEAGKQRASQLVPLERIRPYVVNIGNNGFLSDSGDYWTTEQDIERLFKSIDTAAENWDKKRIMLYLHGGLNSEREVASRIVSFKNVCLENQIYPVHIMWETDFWTSLKNDLLDIFTDEDKAKANWLNRLRDGTIEILDRTFELSSAKLGTMLWDEMKENAKLASQKGRAIDTLAKRAIEAFNSINGTGKDGWELHIVAHSAGAIFTAYAIDKLLDIGVPIKSIQFLAPAITNQLFKDTLLKHIMNGKCPSPTVYALSDVGELDDNVGPYGKSLLYLVSNAFERKRETPLLGMERFVNQNHDPNESTFKVDKEIGKLLSTLNRWPSLVISGKAPAHETMGASICRSDTHGGFDNDPYTLNSVLYRILDKAPKRPFNVRDLQH